jgi:hypothetical protein
MNGGESAGRMRWILCLTLALGAPAAREANCQIIVPPPPVGGVYVDPSGVVRSRNVVEVAGAKPSGRKGRPAAGRGEVPLVKLFADARSEIESAGRLSDRLAFLEGLVSIEALRFDPDAREIWLVGVRDEILTPRTGMPVGRDSQRPAMWIGDLVVAFRTVGPGRPMQPFGCSIDMAPEGLLNAEQAAQELIAQGNYSAQDVVRAMESAIGLQKIRVFGVASNTPFAFACVEADVRLKRLSLGLDPSPVKRVKSHLSMSREHGGAYTRWWFVPDYGPIEVSEEGRRFGLTGPRLKLLASDSPTEFSKPTASAQRFVTLVNQNIAELCEAVPEFGRLRNLTDMAVAAALVSSDRLHERVGWDLAWVATGFPVPETPVPQEAEPLVNMVRKGSVVNVSAGGVQIDVGRVVRGKRGSAGAGGAAPSR